MIPELYAKPVLDTADEEIRRIKEHYSKALVNCPCEREKRQYVDLLQRKSGLILRITTTIRIPEDNSEDEERHP